MNLHDQKKNWQAVAVALMLAQLQACCSPDVKPGEANIFQAACGVSSGQYQQDLDKKQAEADRSRSELQAEQGRSDDLQDDLAVARFRRQQAETELLEMEQQNHLLEQEIRQMSATTEQDKQTRQQKLAELEKLNTEIAVLKANLRNEPDNPQYLDELDALKKEVETLRMIVLEQ
ncbi:MAG: hypothetical protein KDJ38_03275 [Gammaproteobacteria bacterium]|nr:hypothetical protein [Gammaproteobacteria bacterium]